jgi:CheY-like chemotaxis protein
MQKSILVVDDMAVLREPIAASLRLAGYQTEYACDGEEALRLTRAHHPDVILLDIAMPKMDGITFLRRLRSDPTVANTHVILLTVHGEKHSILAAGALGVKDYVLKSHFHLKELLDRIKKSGTVAPGETTQPGASIATKDQILTPEGAKDEQPIEISRLVSREEFVQKTEQAFQGKTLSGIVMEVVAKASSPRGDTAELAALISRDTLLSARVLQAANSALYATTGAGAVTTISHAIRKVGYTAVRNIAAALGIFECMPEGGKDGFNPIRCWQHSFAVATLCELLANEKRPEISGLAYVVGLCHDLGDIFLHTQFDKEYRQVIEASIQTGQSVEELTGRMLGMTPAQIATEVLKSVGLPEEIRRPIETLHSGTTCESTDPLTRILWMGENYANAAMLASTSRCSIAPVTKAFCRVTTGLPSPSIPDLQSFRSQILSLTVTLAKLSRADEAKLLAPTFEMRDDINLWIARDDSISDLDPIEMALESLTRTTVKNRLPIGSESEEINGLVVIAASSKTTGLSTGAIEETLNRLRSMGKNLPILAICSNSDCLEHKSDLVTWRSSAALADLASFIDSLDEIDSDRVAA